MAKVGPGSNYTTKGQLERQTSALLTERSALLKNSYKAKSPYGHEQMSTSKSRHPKVQKIASAINEVIQMCKGENQEATDEFGEVIRAEQGIYDLLIPNYESQLITAPEKNRKHHPQGTSYQRKISSNFADPNSYNEYNINPSQNIGSKNTLGDDAIFMIQEIQKKALLEIQMLRREKAELIRLLNLQIQHHQQEKRRRIWLEGELQRVVNSLKNQGINVYPNGIPFQSGNQGSNVYPNGIPFQSGNQGSNSIPFQSAQSVSIPLDSGDYQPLHHQRVPSKTFDVQEHRNRPYIEQGLGRSSGRYENEPGVAKNAQNRNGFERHLITTNDRFPGRNTGNIDQEEQIIYPPNYLPHQSYQNANGQVGVRPTNEQPIVLKNKLMEAQNRAIFLKSEIERLKGSNQGANPQLYNLLLQLLQEGQRIRKQTIRLLKNKQISGEEGDRIQELQEQLLQQQENKSIFMEDLKKFKQKYKQLEEENAKLRGERGKPSTNTNIEGIRGKTKLTDHQSFLSEIRKVTSN